MLLEMVSGLACTGVGKEAELGRERVGLCDALRRVSESTGISETRTGRVFLSTLTLSIHAGYPWEVGITFNWGKFLERADSWGLSGCRLLSNMENWPLLPKGGSVGAVHCPLQSTIPSDQIYFFLYIWEQLFQDIGSALFLWTLTIGRLVRSLETLLL